MNKLKTFAMGALAAALAVTIAPNAAMAGIYDNNLQIKKGVKVLKRFNEKVPASARYYSAAELAFFEANPQSVDVDELWWAVVVQAMNNIPKYSLGKAVAGGEADYDMLCEIMRTLYNDILDISFPVVGNWRAKSYVKEHIYEVVDSLIYEYYDDIIKDAIEIANEDVALEAVGVSVAGVAGIVGLHALGTGISHWVAKDRQDRGLLKPEEVTLSYKVGDYVASKGAVKYVGNIVKDGIMIGTVTIRTSIPGPSTGFMRVSAKVKLSSRTYSYSKMQVQSKVEGPLQVTLTSKKAGVPILPLLFGGDKVAGKIAGYEFECSR